jgi:phosphate transport system substrate-binding protein
MRLLGLALAITLVSCGAVGSAPTADPLAGKYTAWGSSTTLDNATLITQAFAKLHPGVVFNLNVTDTETSIVKVNHGDTDADFGFVGRELLPSEGKVTLTPIGSTGSTFAVNVSNMVRSLTKEQMRGLLSGQITDWSAVGGTGAVRVIIREPTSTTRKGLEQYVFGTEKPVYAATASTTSSTNAASSEMLDSLKSFSGSIGMVNIDSKALSNKSISLLQLDGVMPTLSSLTKGTWPVRRPVFLSSNTDPTKVKPAIKALLEFAKSPEGQQALSGN